MSALPGSPSRRASGPGAPVNRNSQPDWMIRARPSCWISTHDLRAPSIKQGLEALPKPAVNMPCKGLLPKQSLRPEGQSSATGSAASSTVRDKYPCAAKSSHLPGSRRIFRGTSAISSWTSATAAATPNRYNHFPGYREDRLLDAPLDDIKFLEVRNCIAAPSAARKGLCRALDRLPPWPSNARQALREADRPEAEIQALTEKGIVR